MPNISTTLSANIPNVLNTSQVSNQNINCHNPYSPDTLLAIAFPLSMFYFVQMYIYSLAFAGVSDIAVSQGQRQLKYRMLLFGLLTAVFWPLLAPIIMLAGVRKYGAIVLNSFTSHDATTNDIAIPIIHTYKAGARDSELSSTTSTYKSQLSEATTVSSTDTYAAIPAHRPKIV